MRLELLGPAVAMWPMADVLESVGCVSTFLQSQELGWNVEFRLSAVAIGSWCAGLAFARFLVTSRNRVVCCPADVYRQGKHSSLLVFVPPCARTGWAAGGVS